MTNETKYNYEIKVPINLLGLVGKLNEYGNKIGYSSNYRYFGYNDNSGNVYMYDEMEQFSLFISEFDDENEIKFVGTDYNDGEELILDEQEILDILKYQVIDGCTDKINGIFDKWVNKRNKEREQEE
jgi:hypothetical protein